MKASELIVLLAKKIKESDCANYDILCMNVRIESEKINGTLLVEMETIEIDPKTETILLR